MQLTCATAGGNGSTRDINRENTTACSSSVTFGFVKDHWLHEKWRATIGPSSFLIPSQLAARNDVPSAGLSAIFVPEIKHNVPFVSDRMGLFSIE